ncbi:MAG: hypothetical protein IBX60_08150 [Candidatus Aminicenantes bacterium]|nr:hypothetical protein [Candidatus Aminicenantes bacterium]
MSEFDEDQAFAILLTNLGKKKRTENLLKIAEYCVRLKERYGSWTELANKIVISEEREHISAEMLREFGAIWDLPDEIKQMIQNDMITSVDTAYRISRLKNREDDQIKLANTVVERKLSASDVRAIVEYKLKNPNVKIEQAIQRVLESKTRIVTHHIVIMELKKQTFESLRKEAERTKQTPENLAYAILSEKWDKHLILSFGMRGSDIIMKLSEEGFKALQNQAKTANIQLKDLADKELQNKLLTIG